MTEDYDGCSMFGAFNLKAGQDIDGFEAAFDAFCGHLRDQGYVREWRLWERAYHDGYDTRFPDVSVVLEMRFHDHQSSIDAWAYIEAGSQPMRGLHRAMNAMVEETYFVLCNERKRKARVGRE